MIFQNMENIFFNKNTGMFHDSANWADRLEKLPANLAALYTYCKYNAEVFGDCMLDWEFWNEQDIGFAPESAWDYAAAFKAAYLGFKAGKKDMPVTFGAICAGPLNPYVYTMFENDSAKFSDFANFHTYAPIANYPAFYNEIHKLLDDIGPRTGRSGSPNAARISKAIPQATASRKA